MTDSKVISLNKLKIQDPLQQILKEGARKLLAQAVEAELEQGDRIKTQIINIINTLKTDAKFHQPL